MNFKTIAFGVGAVAIFAGLMFAISRIPANAPAGGTNEPAGVEPVITGGESTLGISSIGQGFAALGVKVTPVEVVEDSRCPTDVVCIQAGTVRVRATLESGLGKANQIFTLNQPITTEAEIVTLVSVQPQPLAGQTVDPKKYIFTFKVEKR